MGTFAARHTVKLFNGTDGTVLAVVEAPDVASWAAEMGTIARFPWQSDGSDFACAEIPNTPGLLALLKSEGYKVDASEFSEAS